MAKMMSAPYFFVKTKNPKESIRDVVTRFVSHQGRSSPPIRVLGPVEVVYWYSPTSYEPTEDLFFKHGSFFNPELGQSMAAINATGGDAGNSAQTKQDGVKSITFGHVYKEGATSFTHVDLSNVPPLPGGYLALDNQAHRIATDAVVSGPHVVSFDVPSSTDQSMFNDLAIFHLEQDRFDPDNLVWVDTTILSPDTPAPDFVNRIISARVNSLGDFVIGKLVQAQPNLGSSDLSVTVADSPDPVVVENNLTYTLHVSNSGPQSATGAGLVHIIPSEAAFVSATPTQGSCKFKDGRVYCKFGTVANGGSCDVTIVVNTREDKAGVPSQGKLIESMSVVAADNDDADLSNNAANNTTTLLPSSNSRPLVTISSPTAGTTYGGPTNITISATATDIDGTVTKVDFYDGTTLVGTSTSGVNHQYQLSFSANLGGHTFLAIATDNGGRTNSSDAVNVFVNGTATLNITSPTAGSVFDPQSSLTITANATNSSGQISRVEFFANQISLGALRLNGAVRGM